MLMRPGLHVQRDRLASGSQHSTGEQRHLKQCSCFLADAGLLGYELSAVVHDASNPGSLYLGVLLSALG